MAAVVAAKRRAWVEQVMGLPVSVHVRGPAADSPRADAAVREVFAELHAADRRFSTYRADSEVCRWRRGEVAVPSGQLREVLDLCAEAAARTAGAFSADLSGGFDPSGLVKGWAVERAAAALAQLAGQDAMVVAGGDIALRCVPGSAWTVGIEDPRDPSRVLRAVQLGTGAIATSGTAHRGDHVLDPRTGEPARRLLSATVIGPSLLWADVYATAALVLGEGALDWLAAHPPYAGLLVTPDGRQLSSLPA